MGTGLIGGSVLMTGGIIAPGENAIGTLTVQGNFSQTGGTYQAVTTPGTNNSSLIKVGGAATISNDAVLNVSNAADLLNQPGHKYTVLTAAGGVSGLYTLSASAQTAILRLVETSDANNIYLTAEQYRSLSGLGASGNEAGVGAALDALSGTALYHALANLSDDDALNAALDQLSGEVDAAVQSALIEDSAYIRDAALDRARQQPYPNGHPIYGGGGMKLRMLGGDGMGTAWLKPLGSWNSNSGDGNAGSTTEEIKGLIMGADTALAGFNMGVLGSYTMGALNDDGRGAASIQQLGFGLYGGKHWRDTVVSAGASYQLGTIGTQRNPQFAGFSDSDNGSFKARTAQVFAEAGQEFSFTSDGFVQNWGVEPFTNLALVNLRADAFTEKGGGAALKSVASTSTLVFATLGLRAAAQVYDRFHISGMAGWRFGFGDLGPTSTNSFVAGGPAFTVSGLPVADNLAIIELGVDADLTRDATVGAHYRGAFGSSFMSNSMDLSVDYKF